MKWPILFHGIGNNRFIKISLQKKNFSFLLEKSFL